MANHKIHFWHWLREAGSRLLRSVCPRPDPLARMRSEQPWLFERFCQWDVPDWLVSHAAHVLLKALRMVRPSETMDIVYVAGGARFDTLKDIVALRQARPESRILYLDRAGMGDPDGFLAQGVDVRQWHDGLDLVAQLAGIKARTLVVSSKLNRTALAMCRLMWRGRFVYRANEIALRIPREMWGDPLMRRKVDVETLVLRTADVILHTYDDATFAAMAAEIKVTGQGLSLPPQCLPQFSPKMRLPKLHVRDGDVHVAYVASLSTPSDDAATTRQACQVDNFRAILSAGAHVHVYDAHGYFTEGRDSHDCYRQLEREYPNFHIHPRLSYDGMVVALTQYDLGLPYFNLEPPFRIRDGWRSAIGNNFFVYAQAGLPMVVHPSSEGMAHLVEAHDIGMALTQDELYAAFTAIDHAAIDKMSVNVMKHSENGVLRYPSEQVADLILPLL